MLLKNIEFWEDWPTTKEIVILRPHKGSGTVILNRDDLHKEVTWYY